MKGRRGRRKGGEKIEKKEKRSNKKGKGIIQSIIGFVIANAYMAVFGMYFGTSKAVDVLLLLNLFLVCLPALLCFVFGMVEIFAPGELDEDED